MLDLGDPVCQPLPLPLGSWAPECLDVPSPASPSRVGWGPRLRARRGGQFWQPESSRGKGEPVCQVGSRLPLAGWVRPEGVPAPPGAADPLPNPTFHSHALSPSFGEIEGLCGTAAFWAGRSWGAPPKRGEWEMPEWESASFLPVTEPGAQGPAPRAWLAPAGKELPLLKGPAHLTQGPRSLNQELWI